jgi:outer membrane autotransporter protein
VVDVGAYSYGLKKEGTDWFLDPNNRVISPGTRSVLALFNTAPTVWYGEATSLRTRMGELRFEPGQAGLWIRGYGNKYEVSDSTGVGYSQNQQGFTLGADTPLADSQWMVGVMAGHSSSDLNLKRGTSGTVKSYYLGAYATWLEEESGLYFDAVAKVNRFQNESKVGLSDGTSSKGKYSNTGGGLSAEFGRNIKLDDGFFVEPYAQVSTVVIQGANYNLDNGLQAKGERTRSIMAKAGATVGRDIQLDSGSVVQPYLRAAMVHEFANNNKVSVNNNVFNNDLSGSRAEFGAGVAVKLSQNVQLHADLEHSSGGKVEQPWGANVGVRYTW